MLTWCGLSLEGGGEEGVWIYIVLLSEWNLLKELKTW